MNTLIDIKSMIIGILISIVVYYVYSMYFQRSEKTDHIVASAITLKDAKGNTVLEIGSDAEGGYVWLMNAEGKIIAYLGADDNKNGIFRLNNLKGTEVARINSGKEGHGYVKMLNSIGKTSAYIGAIEDGDGFLSTFNRTGNLMTYIGTGKESNGYLQTFNKENKETVYLGTGEGGIGFLKTSNSLGINTVFIGTNKLQNGSIHLFDNKETEKWKSP